MDKYLIDISQLPSRSKIGDFVFKDGKDELYDYFEKHPYYRKKSIVYQLLPIELNEWLMVMDEMKRKERRKLEEEAEYAVYLALHEKFKDRGKIKLKSNDNM